MNEPRYTLPNDGRPVDELAGAKAQSAIDRSDYRSDQNVLLARLCNRLMVRLDVENMTIAKSELMGTGLVLVEPYDDCYCVSRLPAKGGS